MSLETANEFLMAGGTPSAKFPTPGTTVTGTIVRTPEVQQQTDVTTGEPKFWPSDGKPMQQLQVQLQTSERDPAVDHDDGIRAVYVKGKMQAAVREAVRRSGAKGLEVGGTLTVTYTGDGEATKRGMNAPKIYSASYIPAPAVAANQFLEQGESAPADPWANGAPVQQPPAPAPVQAAPPGVSPETFAALQQLTPEQRALLNLPA